MGRKPNIMKRKKCPTIFVSKQQQKFNSKFAKVHITADIF